MIALLSFLHSCFLRSYRYGPPLAVFGIGIAFVYSVVPNPVMESYAFSSAFLFAVASAIGYMIVDLETGNQEMITLRHAGGAVPLYTAKWLYAWLFTLPMALYAVLYPALLGRFDRFPEWHELGYALLAHIAVSWLAVAVSFWFSSKLIASRLLSFLALALAVIASFGSYAIAGVLPKGLDGLTLLLPPVNRIISLLGRFDTAGAGLKWGSAAACFVYGGILGALFLLQIRKRKLEAAR